MAKLLYTIGALLLSAFDLQIFETCLASAMEDEACESLLMGPPCSSLIFSAGVYVIIFNSTLFPRSFNEPKTIFLVMYEFLATAFILEFAMACIWTPIDVLLLTTIPFYFRQMVRHLGFDDAVGFAMNKSSMMIVTYTVAFTFFLLTLHVTDAVDYTIIRDSGVTPFALHVKEKLWEMLQRELPFFDESTKSCRCKVRKRGRRKTNANSSR